MKTPLWSPVYLNAAFGYEAGYYVARIAMGEREFVSKDGRFVKFDTLDAAKVAADNLNG